MPEQELTTRTQLPASANIGAISIEQERAIAEAQGQMTLAKRFPRDMNSAFVELMESCSNKAFANSAFYSVPNRGSGPSIRFAEEVARVYGNFVYGHKELSRSEGKSEVEVFAWDMEKNNRSTRQITIMHIQDVKDGAKKLTSQADIDNKIANVASKQIRGRILALLPKPFVTEAIEKCKATIAGASTEPISARIRKMADSFNSKYGVTTEMIERYIGNKLDETTIDQLTDLIGVFNALKEGAKVAEYFGKSNEVAKTDDALSAAIAGAQPEQAQQIVPQVTKPTQTPKVKPEAKPTQATVQKPKAEPKPEPKAEPVAEPVPEDDDESVF